jgi:phage baseplate assembly protein W
MSNRAIAVPHFSLPLTLGVGGTFACVEQDSEEDIVQGVYVLLTTPLGRQIELPDYGYADQTFTPLPGIDVAAAQAAVEEWQPRARIHARTSVSTVDELIQYVSITMETGLERTDA